MKGVLRKVTKGPRCLALVLVWLLVFSQNVAMADERVLVYVVSGITYADKNTTYGQHKYNSHWQYWSQGASGYLNGNDPSILHNMPQFGCRVVAQAKLLVEAGLASSSTSMFNPDIYYAWTVANGYQGGSDHVNSPYETSTQGTAIIQWGSNKGITVKKRIEEIDPSMSVYAKAALVMHYINNGYYVLLGNDNHYVYILSAASRARGTPVVSDSSGSYSQNSNQCYTLVSHQGESPYDTIVVFSMDGSSISDPDTQKPSVNTAASSITGVSPVDYYVQVSASDNFYVSKIVIGSWNDVCGIDNAQWQTHYVDGTNASATFKISVSDFGNQLNTVYHTNAYAVDACGNRSEIVRIGDVLIELEAPAPIVSATDEFHAVKIDWEPTNYSTFYSIRLYDMNGNLLYLRDNYQKTSFAALLPAGEYQAEICSVIPGVWLSASNRVSFNVTPGYPTHTANCKADGILGGKLYKLYEFDGTWLEARAKARLAGGRLAIVNSQAKQNCIYSMMAPFNQLVFLGAQGYTNYSWLWEDGSALDGFTYWDNYKPDNWEGYENCLIMYPSNGSWDDYPNDSALWYVAEYDMVNLTVNAIESVWLNGTESIRENLSVTATFSDGSSYPVREYEIQSCNENNGIMNVVVDYAGFSGSCTISTTPPNESPRITDCQIVNVGPRGYDIVCEATDDHGVVRYVFVTWHDSMRVEDALGETVEADAYGSITYHVDPSRFNWSTGTNYSTRVIAFDGDDAYSEVLEVTAFIPVLDLYTERDESMTLYLPSNLITIQSGAFDGVAARYFVLPSSVTTIESDAFPSGSTVFLYGNNIRSFSADLFSGTGTIVEMGSAGSSNVGDVIANTAITYVMRNGRQAEWLTPTIDDTSIIGSP